LVWKSTSFALSRALEHAKSRAIHQERHQSWSSAQSLDDGTDLVTGQDDRKPWRSLSSDQIVEPGKILVEDFAIEEEECTQGLVLRGRRHAAVHGQEIQEASDFGRAHLRGMPFAVEEDVAAHPRDVRLLRPAAVMTRADRFTDTIEQSGLGRLRGRRLMERAQASVQRHRIASESNGRQFDQGRRLSVRS
jgi:hypothetical protein